MTDGVREVNFDGLVGPTHHFLNTSPGNLASEAARGEASNPRVAALQGLDKMATVAGLGVMQAVIPPQIRPDLGWLRRLGFAGSDVEVLRAVRESAPGLLAASSSSSFMWAANAATVSPSADTGDGRVHLTPANLLTATHRSLEAGPTEVALRSIFVDGACFTVHAALPACRAMSDEGAANHTRFTDASGQGRGVHLFVYGFDDGDAASGPRRYPARQGRAACEAIARQHGLDPACVVYARQPPEAIDAGAFHNDVVAVGHGDLLIAHEQAFADVGHVAESLESARRASGMSMPIVWCEVPAEELSLSEAVKTYLFNSQLLTAEAGETVLVAPRQCERDERARRVIERRLIRSSRGPIDRAVYVDVEDSIRNGGGPACLRLRAAMTPAERASLAPGVWWSRALHERLATWIKRWYLDRLTLDDLADLELARSGRAALLELAEVMGLIGTDWHRRLSEVDGDARYE